MLDRHSPPPLRRPGDSRPLRVAVVVNNFPSTSQTFVLDHVTGLLDRHHDVRVFANAFLPGTVLHSDHAEYGLDDLTHYWPGPPATATAKLLSLIRSLPALPPSGLSAVLRQPPSSRVEFRLLEAHLRRARFLARHLPRCDIVHAHFGQEGETMAWMKARGATRARLVVSLHGYDVNQPLAAGGTHYPLMFGYADRIVATTRFMGDQVLALGCPPEKLALNPIGIRTDRFAFAERSWAPPDELRLLSIARLVEFKGIEIALRAIAQVAASGLRIGYSIAGAGPLAGMLDRLARELGIREAVRFLGAQTREELAREFASAHLFVLPSHTASDGAQEGQGIVVQEAQACGLPVLATRHGGIPEGCVDGVTAVLAREKDVGALAAGLRHLIERRASWPEMGRAGRAFVASRFDLAIHLDRVEDLYRSALAVHGPPAGPGSAAS